MKDARDPAVVFFPTNADSDCMDGSAGGGFNTFGFIAMMLATYNLVGLVSNNGNQNNNNQERILSRFQSIFCQFLKEQQKCKDKIKYEM